jgi:hydroxypyruvate reductase
VNADNFDPRRELLLGLFQAGLARVDGRRCVSAALTREAPAAPVYVAAVGKAATAMALGAHDALGGAIERTLIITRDAADLGGFPRGAAPELWLAAHPVPDERSLAAGARLLAWVDELPARGLPLFLISGGSSSLVEVLEPPLTLRDLEELTRQALASGSAIGEINAQRAARSRIKGGRLAACLGGREARALFVSDVPHDDPRVIGSGLMGPAPTGRRRRGPTTCAARSWRVSITPWSRSLPARRNGA